MTATVEFTLQSGSNVRPVPAGSAAAAAAPALVDCGRPAGERGKRSPSAGSSEQAEPDTVLLYTNTLRYQSGNVTLMRT